MVEEHTVTTEKRVAGILKTAAIVIVCAALFIAFIVQKPSAPQRITLLTGPEGGAYQALGLQLANDLSRQGLQVDVRVTDGGFDNVHQLLGGLENTVVLAPSNIEEVAGKTTDTSNLVTMGSIAYEPLWLFHESSLEVDRVSDLAGLRVFPGSEGSVVRYLADRLLEMNGVSHQIEYFSGADRELSDALDALIAGEIDAMFAMGGPQAPVIQDLLAHDSLVAMSFVRADAYQARFPGVTKLIVPEGVLDLSRDIPDEELILLSATTNLVTVSNLYPGVTPLMLSSMAAIQEQQTFFVRGISFPSADNISLPLKPAARRYYEHGKRGLARFLPYNVTRWLNHLGLFVLPLLTLVVVLLKTVPLALRTWGRIQLTGLFKTLEAVEKGHAAGVDTSALLDDLDRLDHRSAEMFVSRSIVHDYVDFRQFLHDMRERVGGK